MNLSTDFFDFLKASPGAPFVKQIVCNRFFAQGCQSLEEGEALKIGNRYIISRGNLVCLINYQNEDPQAGFKIIAAHSDFPALKVKPNPSNLVENYLSLGVELYGSPILTTWFDRNLSLAGPVYWKNDSGQLCQTLLNFKEPLVYLPNVALHLDRSVNQTKSIDKQKELLPIIGQFVSGGDFLDIIKQRLQAEIKTKVAGIVDYDLILYDIQGPMHSGCQREFITAQGLDNLLSVFCAVAAFEKTDRQQNSIVILYDNEEIGSRTLSGAAGNFLERLLKIIYPNVKDFTYGCLNSFLVSVDNTHGVHPSYLEKHDLQHKPLLNRGLVFKYSAAQRYTSTGETSSRFQHLLSSNQIAYQKFISHNNIAAGSTVGPIVSSALGIPAVDIGLATWAMHSIREVAGSDDLANLVKALECFITQPLPAISG